MELQAYENRQKDIYQNKVNHGFNITDPYVEVRYMMEEVAEFMRAIEHKDKPNMLEELADIVIFAYGLAEITDAGDLDSKIFEKMQINAQRKYIQNSEGEFVKVGGDTHE